MIFLKLQKMFDAKMSRIVFIFSIILLFCRIKAEINDVETHLNFKGAHPIQINKVSFTQKGYIQFLRYLTDVPPVEDFTFCIWLKSVNLTYAHPLLSYSMHETDRFIRAWVTPHGEEIKLALREKEIFSVAVGLQEHQWYHICPSWSSRTGHWDLYLNGKLKAHGFREKARGLILPKNGDLVVGQEYTDFDKGLDDGIEGDIFGFNMVLSSTTSKGQGSKMPFRFNRRRISNLERRMDQGYMVSSPTLMLRRKSRKTEGEMTGEKNIEVKGIGQNNVTYEDVVIDKELQVPSTEFEKSSTDIQRESVNQDDIVKSNRKKRQSYSFLPTSYSNFNFGSKPSIFRSFEQYFAPKVPPPYAIRQPYYPGSYMSPPRKVSRIANDLVPFIPPNNKPLGLKLVELSFNCVLGKGAPLKNVLVSWTKTPVRVFGGAILKKGDPFCLAKA